MSEPSPSRAVEVLAEALSADVYSPEAVAKLCLQALSEAGYRLTTLSPLQAEALGVALHFGIPAREPDEITLGRAELKRLSEDCQHEWASARNVEQGGPVESGEVCLKCRRVRASEAGWECE